MAGMPACHVSWWRPTLPRPDSGADKCYNYLGPYTGPLDELGLTNQQSSIGILGLYEKLTTFLFYSGSHAGIGRGAKHRREKVDLAPI